MSPSSPSAALCLATSTAILLVAFVGAQQQQQQINVTAANATTAEQPPPGNSTEDEDPDQPFSWLYKALDYRTHWSYDDELGRGPPFWCKRYPNCCGQTQSPLELGNGIVPLARGVFEPLQLRDYTLTPKVIGIENNGHTVNLYIKSDDVKPELSGGGLNGTYLFHSVHFHWGKNDTNGAEHSLYGAKFPLEMHMVHYRNTYKDLLEARAATDPAAVAVLGVLLHLSSYETRPMRIITKALRHVAFPNYHQNLTDRFALRDLLPKNVDNFFRYTGSLTTPPCEEIVQWTVFKWSQPVTLPQMTAFRKIYEEDRGALYRMKLVNNFRPLQQLNGRSIADVNTQGVLPHDEI